MSNSSRESEILVSKDINSNIPVLIVDFDNFNLIDSQDKFQSSKILKNLEGFENIITTSKDNNPIAEAHSYKKVYDWSYNGGERFLEDLGDLAPTPKIQLCGIYRELCIVEVASLIKKSGLNIEPIIIDNDEYSISATYSVQEGDTLENRLLEHNFTIKY